MFAIEIPSWRRRRLILAGRRRWTAVVTADERGIRAIFGLPDVKAARLVVRQLEPKKTKLNR